MAGDTADRSPLQAIQGIGAVLVNATLYGLYHGITVKSLES